jgi:hypothetical protein
LFFPELKDKTPNGFWLTGKGKLVLPGQEDYAQASLLFRSQVAVLMTSQEHLVHLHWLISNSATFNAETYLSATHPLRRFLKPHTFHNVNINAASTQALLALDSLLYRLVAFDETNWFQLFKDLVTTFKYETLEDHFKASNLPDYLKAELPLYEDGLDLWKIHAEYVNEYVNIFYKDDESLLDDGELREYWKAYKTFLPPYAPSRDYGLGVLTKENLKKHLTHVVWWVTGGHQFVGSLTEYILDPSVAPFRVVKKDLAKGKDLGADYKTFANTLSLFALTGIAQPRLLGDWSHLHNYEELDANPVKKEKVLQSLINWQDKLQALIPVIDARNKKRVKNFDVFNPRILQSAVSI